MKNLLIVVFISILIVCARDMSTEPEVKTPMSNSSEYFPLADGNEWFYYEPGRQDATRSIRVWQTFTLGDSLFFIYGNKLGLADTLYQDAWGRVYKRRNGHTQMWLDFSVENEGTYKYTLSEKLDYTVTVKKNLSINYDDHAFTGCISISFDAPEIADEEIIYVFAPEVGIVQSPGAWVTTYLARWELY